MFSWYFSYIQSISHFIKPFLSLFSSIFMSQFFKLTMWHVQNFRKNISTASAFECNANSHSMFPLRVHDPSPYVHISSRTELRFVVPSVICCRPFPKKHSVSTCPVLHFNLTPSPLPSTPPSLSHNPLACHTVQHVLSFNSGLWDTHSPTGASATAAAWELISMSSTSLGAFAISALRCCTATMAYV